MLIRSKQYNALVDFKGTAIYWDAGYLKCASGGRSVELVSIKFDEASRLIDDIQNAFLIRQEIFIIE